MKKRKDIKARKNWGDCDPVTKIVPDKRREKEEKWIPRKALEELEENGDFDKFNLEKET